MGGGGGGGEVGPGNCQIQRFSVVARLFVIFDL